MKRKKLLMGSLALGLLILGGTMAQAGSTFVGYDKTVGAFNGSAYTASQTKELAGVSGNLRSSTVGGSYKVDARMYNGTRGTGSWVRIDDGYGYMLPNGIGTGYAAQVQFSNDVTTPVSVRVTGSWRSN